MTVRMTPNIKDVESKFGKPLATILIDLYKEHRKLSNVAKVLGVSQSTISYWMARENLEIVPVMVRVQYKLTSKGEDYVRSMHSESSQGLDNVAMAVAVGD